MQEEVTMFKAYWGMSRDPFTKEIDIKDAYVTEDFKQASERTEHLKKYPGIGVFTGRSGCGKSLSMRAFVEGLNPNLYKWVYTPLANISESEFFRIIASGFGLEPSYRRGDNIKRINERMSQLFREQKITPVILIDEAQCIKSSGFIQSLQALMNFEMDSRDYGIMVLSGQNGLNNTLGLGLNDAFEQRIVVNYDFQGITREETTGYVQSRMKLADASPEIFDPAAVEAAYSCCKGSIRVLNQILKTALMIGCNEKARTVSNDMIRLAANEVSILK